MIKTYRTIAAALLIAGGLPMLALPAFAREKKAEQGKGPKLTPAVQNALASAQTKQKAGDNPGALADVRTAEAAANRTPMDNYYIANIKIGIAQTTKDNTLLKEALRGALDSGQAPPEQTTQFTRVLADLAVNEKDYPTAAHYYEIIAKQNPNDPDIAANLAKLTYDNRQLPVAQRLAALKNATDIAERANKKPEEFLYGARLQLAYDNKMAADINPAGEAFVRAYPSPKNWASSIDVYQQATKLDDQSQLDVYRLKRATGSLNGEAQYLDYAQTAQIRGLPGEARAVLSEGAAKKVVDPSKPNYLELSRLVSAPKVSADLASLPASERKAAAASTGTIALGTADAYLGHANYAKAATLYKLALSKGGVDSARVNTRLGIALAMSGDKPGAEAAFKAVTSEPRATLAQYWLIWLGQKA